MEQDEIRQEIERRKKRAKDLKLRELLWSLFYSHLERYPDTLKKDPTIIFPAIKETIAIENNHFRFCVGNLKYEVIYKPGPEKKDSYGSRNWEDEIVTTPITLSLKIDDQLVFEFQARKTVQYTLEMPLFNEYMGEVTAFIDGAWVPEFVELVPAVDRHRRAVRDQQMAPQREQKLREDMKRFGL